MLFNSVMLFLIAAGGAGAVIYNIRKTMNSSSEYDEEYQNIYTIQYLVDYVKATFSEYMKANLNESVLNRNDYDLMMSKKLELRRKLKEAAYGNRDAKDYIKSTIRDLLMNDLKLEDPQLYKIIPFDKTDELSSVDMTEILIYAFSKYCSEKTEGKYTAKEGLTYMIDKYDMAEMHPDDTESGNPNDWIYDISAKMILDVYEKEMQEGGVLADLGYMDRINIITQRIFEKYKGFGAADMLIDSSVDEVDCGVSGVPKDSFEVNRNSITKVTYSYESIWIMYHGLNIRMSCMYFESQAELIRVTQNIYRYEAPTVLSRKEGRVFSTMKDGSRVVAVRPPFADSYAFFVRKHNAEIAKDTSELFKNEGHEYIDLLMKWLIRGHRNMIFTGSQGTGKTTTMKAYIKYIPVSFNIRIQELMFELNLRYIYPNRNIVTFQETADITSQEGLDTQKKTNGTVNIIGEIATAMAASWYIQTSKVASLFAWASHHAKTAENLVTAIRDNLLQTNIFSDEKAAEIAVAEAIDIDVHMEKNDDTKERFMERITEIIPIRDHSYPTDTRDDLSLDAKYKLHTMEAQKRQTDRKLFTTRNLLEYRDGKYVMVAMPTEETLAEIRSKILPSQREEFDRDMETLRNAIVDVKTA